MEAHPYADCFPLLPEDLIAELASDIERHGLRSAIVTYQGKILDGRNRFTACELVAVDPRFEAFDGDDDEAIAFVVSQNIHRRHLTESQRAIAVGALATRGPGRPTAAEVKLELEKSTSVPECAISQDTPKELTIGKAAKRAKVGRRLMQQASAVVKMGDAETVQRVRDGKLSIPAALQEIAAKQEFDRPVDPHIDEWEEHLTDKSKEAFADTWRFQQLLTELLGVRHKVQAYCELPSFSFLLKQQVLIDLENASRAIRHAKPYAACPWCEQTGIHKTETGSSDCGACKKLGWITKDRFDTAPADLKAKVPHP